MQTSILVKSNTTKLLFQIEHLYGVYIQISLLYSTLSIFNVSVHSRENKVIFLNSIEGIVAIIMS